MSALLFLVEGDVSLHLRHALRVLLRLPASPEPVVVRAPWLGWTLLLLLQLGGCRGCVVPHPGGGGGGGGCYVPPGSVVSPADVASVW